MKRCKICRLRPQEKKKAEVYPGWCRLCWGDAYVGTNPTHAEWVAKRAWAAAGRTERLKYAPLLSWLEALQDALPWDRMGDSWGVALAGHLREYKQQNKRRRRA